MPKSPTAPAACTESSPIADAPRTPPCLLPTHCSDETVTGSRIVDLLQSTPLDDVDSQLFSSSSGSAAGGAAAPAAAPTSSGGSSRFSGDGAPSAAAARAGSSGAASTSGREAAEEALGEEVMGDEALVALAEVVMGKVSEWDLLPGGKAASKAQRVRQQLLDPEQRRRLKAQAEFASGARRGGDGVPFPPPPPLPAVPPLGEEEGIEAFRPPTPNVFSL